jgi:hypothetical protein
MRATVCVRERDTHTEREGTSGLGRELAAGGLKCLSMWRERSGNICFFINIEIIDGKIR